MTDRHTIRAWKFLRDDMRSGSGYEGPWHIGETRTLVGGRIIPCERGYHGSPTPFDALQYAPGSVVALVDLSGDVNPHGSPVVAAVRGGLRRARTADLRARATKR
jgi:hypothetical protein